MPSLPFLALLEISATKNHKSFEYLSHLEILIRNLEIVASSKAQQSYYNYKTKREV